MVAVDEGKGVGEYAGCAQSGRQKCLCMSHHLRLGWLKQLWQGRGLRSYREQAKTFGVYAEHEVFLTDQGSAAAEELIRNWQV